MANDNLNPADTSNGFKPHLPDDTVEYEIRLLDDKASVQGLRQELRKIQTTGKDLVKKLLRGYIWERESFGLEIVQEAGKPLLRGRTNYGDSVEDEWLIVYLVRELSRQFHSAWVRVVDGDGEFLLIEAANTLPKWVNPDVAEHRVWINRGDLLLIPPTPAGTSSNKQPATFISLPQALAALRRPRSELIHSPIIEAEAFYRLRNYPNQIQQNFHRAVVRMPRRLAFILHHFPTSISPATESFYLRDPVALRPLRENSAKDLTFPPEDLVSARIKFTKVGYAQLRSQRFLPVGVWFAAQANEASANAKDTERREIGMKLSCGFEMLVTDPQNQDKQSVREIKLLLEDLHQGEETLPSDKEIESWGVEEDDDSWLNIDFRDFEDELSGRRGEDATEKSKGDRSRGGFGDKTAQENLQKLVSRFEDFMNDDQLADDDDDDDEDEEDEAPSDEDDDGEDKAASFDEDEFTALMREMMGLPADAMRELMGPQAAKTEGLTDSEHPDFTKGGKDLEERMKQLFDSLDMADDKTAKAEKTEDAAGVKSDEEGERDEEENIKQLSTQMEAELRGAGALDLSDPSVKNILASSKGKAATQPSSSKSKDKAGTDDEDSDEDDEGQLLDEDYNLVANMLRSFSGQAGIAGPAGNMLGMMGVKLPRDDGESDEDEPHTAPEPKGEGKGKGRVEELE